ncbi:MAG: sulfatase [Blastocatellia bacterium]
MRPVIWLLVMGALFGAAQAPVREPARKLNVLFIAADDLNCSLGSYGHPPVKSPNIDKLASAGVRFERAYCQYPLCSPSRASLLTGRYPATTGVLVNGDNFRDRLPDVVTLPHHFRRHGYYTARTGKIFHDGSDDERAWDEIGSPPHVADPAKDGRRPSDRWEAVAGDGEELRDYQTAGHAIRLLEKHKDKPFFLAVGFLKPHGPFVAPKKYFAGYDPKSIRLPADFASVPTIGPGVPAEARPSNFEVFAGREASEQEAREMIAAYYACVSFMDAQVGRVLDALDRLKLRDRTIVVFFGDHGFHLGEKGKWSKHGSLYEVNLRVPLIITAPSAAGNGKSSGRTVQLLDIYPTLAELCDLPLPKWLEGHSLAPLLKDPQARWEHAAYTLVKRGPLDQPELVVGRSVRTERWRYTEWDRGIRIGEGKKAELYDHDADPHELKNLVADPRHAETVKTLRQLLRHGWPNSLEGVKPQAPRG